MATSAAASTGNFSGFIKLTLAFCLGAAVVLFFDHTFQRERTSTHSRPHNVAQQKSDKPWGDLQITSIPFEDSEEIFLDRASRLKKTEWFFEGVSQTQSAGFLQTVDLTDAQKGEVLSSNLWATQGSSCVFRPTDDFVASITESAREKIYGALAQSSSNYAQCFPFRFPPNAFEQRFANSGLPQQGIQLVRSLCYTNDGLLSFCDLGVANKKLSGREFDNLIRVLYSVPTVRLRLHVTADSDINRLVAYWGKGGREHRVRPLIESIARLPGGDTIAIPYLLPGFARIRLYTFPDSSRDPIEPREDCFYTAMNFFNKRADEKYLDKNITKQTLQSDYVLVSDHPTYGDLITLINGNGDALHVAVYIAEDIVFTKNGVNSLQPWVLMRMDDMMAFFPSPQPLQIAIFRKKEFAQATQ